METPGPATEPVSSPKAARRAIAWSKAKVDQTVTWTLGAREKHWSVDVGFRVADRDKRVAAGVLAGGVAYRFFFWMLAMSIVANGVFGFIGGPRVRAALESQGIDADTAAQIQQATEPSDTARWWLLVVGLWLVLWTGYLGAKAIVLVHAAVWGVPPPQARRRLTASAAFTGMTFALLAAMAVARWLTTEIPTLGFIATLAVGVVPFAAWLMVSRWLPHGDAEWTALVPGAIVFAVGVQGLHLFTVFFLGPKLASATELYGIMGLVSTILFWLYITGRLVIGAATLNASYYEQRAQAAAQADPHSAGGSSAV